MIPSGQLTGAVLAGGHSRRMGRDKATLVVGGGPFWLRQVSLLRAAGASPVGVVRRPDQPALDAPPDVPLWLDGAEGIGPLAGIQAALDACLTPWLAVVATDMPHVKASWFQWLGAFCAPGSGAIGRRGDGTYEPLAAIYPRAALAVATQRLAGPNFSLQGLAGALIERKYLVSVPLPEAEVLQFANWNTPADASASAAMGLPGQ